MHRNELYIPSQKSSIVTIKYMKAVAGGKVYAPTYDEVRLAPWRRRLPPRKEVIRELLKATRNMALPLGVVEGKWEPDRKWMLNVIRTRKRDHYFFAKDYVPQLKAEEDSDESEEVSGLTQ